ncbi:MAG: filamentous hemagglutinin N-terminal domain-containing protein, partial [Candidatus Omnitrophica bacterium]|nr:filamentous hemagglutinin N-terminal domain-containing protein [Candidatus Omnitrophota bacterium]
MVQLRLEKLILVLFLVSAYCFPSSYLYALPEGEQVVSGEAVFERADTNTLNITASNNSIIHYSSFSIAKNETVNFFQPTVDSFTLNRVVGTEASNILGTLTANGNLILINTQGISFGREAQVRVGGLMASTLDIPNEDFLSGRYIFGLTDGIQNEFSEITNEGTIETRERGFALLIASSISNEGTLRAPLGTVSLASGNLVAVGLSSDGLVSVAVEAPVSGTVVNQEGKPVTDQIKNLGVLEAGGGQVLLKAEAVDELFEQAINMEGHIEADQAVMGEGGIIEIVAKGPVRIAAQSLSAAQGEVFIQSDEGIEITGNTKTQGNTTFEAKKDIQVNADLTTDSGNLTFFADSDLDGIGSFLQAEDTTLKTTTFGDITIQASGESTLANIISAGSLILKQAGAAVTYTEHPDSTMVTAGSLSIGEGVTLKAANT